MCFFLLRLRSLLLMGSSAGYLLRELKRIYVTVSKNPKEIERQKDLKNSKNTNPASIGQIKILRKYRPMIFVIGSVISCFGAR